MAYNSISGYSTTRLTGLSSGLDTDALIKASLSSSQSKLDRLYQSKTTLEWKRDAYTDVRTKVSDFSNKYMSSLSADNIFSKNAYKQYKVSLSDKYDSYFSVKGTSNAQISSHAITKATLAEKATLAGTKYRNRAAGISGGTNTNSRAAVTGSAKLYKLKNGATDKNDSANYELVDEKDGNLDLKDIYVKGSDGSYKKAFAVGDNTSGAVSFKINDKTVSGTKLSDLIDGVNNNQSRSRATMSIKDGQITFVGTTFGSNSGITFENGAGESLFGKNGVLGIKDTVITAKTVANTDMKLGDLAELRNAGQLYDKDGNKIDTKVGDGNYKVKINGKEFEFTKDDTIQQVLDKVNGSDAKVKMTFENGQFSIRSTVTDSGTLVETENVSGSFFGGDESLTGIAVDSTSDYQTIDRTKDTIASAAAKMGLSLGSGGKLNFSINGVDFSFDKDTTIDKMMSEVNASSANARMTYSQITDSFEITSNSTGRSATVKFDTKDADAREFFGFATSDLGKEVRGKDAELVIDGETITRSSNTFTLDGMEITIKDNFVADMGDDADAQNKLGKPTTKGLGKASFSVEQDVDSTVNKVKAFVTAYNELVDSLYKTTTEQKDYDYEPLTEDERANMEKEDIEKWEAEAKKGILYRDNTISSFLSKMRSAIFQTVEGTGKSAYDIGFNTSKYAEGEYGGKLVFDEDKFRKALTKDPELVSNIMAQVSDASDSSTEYKESGFVTKLYDMMGTFNSDVRKLVSGSDTIKGVNQKITETNTKMQDLLKKMYNEQERLYQQYAQLESLMASYQSQSTWLTNQFSALMGNN